MGCTDSGFLSGSQALCSNPAAAGSSRHPSCAHCVQPLPASRQALFILGKILLEALGRGPGAASSSSL